MMRHFIGAVLAAGVGAGAAAAQNGPVVVELFTSQGCSSCPPADALLAKIAEHDEVLPLSLHVDYWDYIGWKDSFAKPQFTKRQKAYARAQGRRSIYTPQMVIQGTRDAVGHDAMAVMEALNAAMDAPPEMNLTLDRQSEHLTVTLKPMSEIEGPAAVFLVRYMPREHVEILSGENAGKAIDYTNIVSDWTLLGVWSGREEAVMEAELNGSDAAAVLVQLEGPGRILAAARVAD